ncbi:hypothetical protein GUJ93_ZPchr0003g18120 [Zizania palustris]|uniref:Uncharacterized protein n=1 Tax=Zizania palustris TaxID=103762 RepID=A0A8J5SGY2_ZIZPA|nr:hypothetical protein GUJ93_ZPchr0003g18120 [Zizania palustris]
MAAYCCNTYMHELEDVRRWLPSNILSDIGIVDDNAERRRLAIVEDLAARLTSVVGSATGRTHLPVVPPAANSHPLRYAPPAEEAWPFLRNGGRKLDLAVALPRFSPAGRPPLLAAGAVAPVLPPPPNRCGGGTGVFLPRTEAGNRTSATAIGYNAGTKPRYHGSRQQPCRSRQRHRGEAEAEEAAASTRSSRRQFHVYAHAVAAADILGQPRRTANSAPPPHASAEVALPWE